MIERALALKQVCILYFTFSLFDLLKLNFIYLIIQTLHNTAAADKELKKYLLSEEEWCCISDVHGILQVSFICNIYVYMHLYTVYVNIKPDSPDILAAKSFINEE